MDLETIIESIDFNIDDIIDLMAKDINEALESFNNLDMEGLLNE